MRPTKIEYFFKIVEAVALLATCDRGKSGAILVKHNRIIATGYVGAPAGADHCDDLGHAIEIRTLKAWYKEASEHCARTVHAEMNAILQAARYGPSTDGATLYCTMMPCFDCAKAIVNAGIIEVHAMSGYQRGERSKILFDKVGVKYNILDEQVMEYMDADEARMHHMNPQQESC